MIHQTLFYICLHLFTSWKWQVSTWLFWDTHVTSELPRRVKGTWQDIDHIWRHLHAYQMESCTHDQGGEYDLREVFLYGLEKSHLRSWSSGRGTRMAGLGYKCCFQASSGDELSVSQWHSNGKHIPSSSTIIEAAPVAAALVWYVNSTRKPKLQSHNTAWHG